MYFMKFNKTNKIILITTNFNVFTLVLSLEKIIK